MKTSSTCFFRATVIFMRKQETCSFRNFAISRHIVPSLKPWHLEGRSFRKSQISRISMRQPWRMPRKIFSRRASCGKNMRSQMNATSGKFAMNLPIICSASGIGSFPEELMPLGWDVAMPIMHVSSSRICRIIWAKFLRICAVHIHCASDWMGNFHAL